MTGRASRADSGGSAGGTLLVRFRRHLEELGAPAAGETVVVAVSGGLDSLVLLHLLRFGDGLPPVDLVGAHLDHRMRPGSGADARWVRGLLRAWRIEAHFGRAACSPTDEAGARQERYRFLRAARERTGADRILTGHHADDQAETVLFRALRGTGIRGLRGILERREPSMLRPLLPFRRAELEAYAAARRLTPRPDPSNVDRRFARNVIRHELLPRAEETVAPGARRALARLARNAAREEEAWESLLPRLLEPVLIEEEEGETPRFVLDRSGLLSYHATVRARLFRWLARRLGIRLSEAGTREAVEFSSSSASGRRLELPDRVVLIREFDRLVLGTAPERGPNETLDVPGPGSGGGEFTVGGRTMRARWSVGEEPSGAWIERFSPSRLHFPLRLRGWGPGDRIRFPYGSKKLKKVFGERRIPLRKRHRWPVLADAEGRIVWIPGLVRSTQAEPRGGEDTFVIGIADADDP